MAPPHPSWTPSSEGVRPPFSWRFRHVPWVGDCPYLVAADKAEAIRGFDEQLWAQRRFDLVVTGNLAKFGQHVELRDFLLTTGSRVLVEASPVDRIWGIGLAADHEHAASPEHWRGLNLLGFALMEVRHQLLN